MSPGVELYGRLGVWIIATAYSDDDFSISFCDYNQFSSWIMHSLNRGYINYVAEFWSDGTEPSCSPSLCFYHHKSECFSSG